jgi:hypothetical protein
VLYIIIAVELRSLRPQSSQGACSIRNVECQIIHRRPSIADRTPLERRTTLVAAGSWNSCALHAHSLRISVSTSVPVKSFLNMECGKPLYCKAARRGSEIALWIYRKFDDYNRAYCGSVSVFHSKHEVSVQLTACQILLVRCL